MHNLISFLIIIIFFIILVANQFKTGLKIDFFFIFEEVANVEESA